MVDFQSRDTRRGPTPDETEDSDSSADTGESSEDGGDDAPERVESEESPAEPEPDADGESETAGDPLATEREPTDATADTGHPTEDDGSIPDGPLADPGGAEADADTAAPKDDPLADPVETDTDVDSEPTPPTDDPLADPVETDTHVDSEPTPPTDDPLADPGGAEADADTAAPKDDAESAVEAADTEPSPAAPTPSRAVDVAVVTVSGDRAALEDSVTAAFEGAGHDVTRCERLRGGYDAIQQMVDSLVDRAAVDVVVTVGGAGLAADEMAIEAVHPLLEKALPGFGEAFRSRLAEHIGTGIVGVRSTAGVSDGTLVFCLPGDVEAAGLAVREILATEAPFLIDQLEA